MPYAKWRRVKVGQGTERGSLPAVVTVQNTAVGNVGSGEDTLQSYTIKANSLMVNGASLRVTARGYTAANGNNKTLKAYWGTTAIYTSGALAANNKPWSVDIIIKRLSSTTLTAYAISEANATLVAAQRTAITADPTAATLIKFTGEATSNDDIVQDVLIVESLPNES